MKIARASTSACCACRGGRPVAARAPPSTAPRRHAGRRWRGRRSAPSAPPSSAPSIASSTPVQRRKNGSSPVASFSSRARSRLPEESLIACATPSSASAVTQLDRERVAVRCGSAPRRSASGTPAASATSAKWRRSSSSDQADQAGAETSTATAPAAAAARASAAAAGVPQRRHARDDRHAARRVLEHAREHGGALRLGEVPVLAGRAVGDQAVEPGADRARRRAAPARRGRARRRAASGVTIAASMPAGCARASASRVPVMLTPPRGSRGRSC